MINLHKLSSKEIPKLVELERSEDTANYIIPYSAQKHRIEMSKDHVYYLSICDDQVFSGFIILALDGNNSVEFRRIVVGSKDNGIGQIAINKMEEFCALTLRRKRVWLDVFKTNQRGQYLYRKLGYTEFQADHNSNETLLYLEKML